MATTVGSTCDRDGITVHRVRWIIGNLADHAAEVTDLGVDVGHVHLTPRLAESAGGVAQHGVSFVDELTGDVTRARLAPGVAMDERDERKGSAGLRTLQGDVEARAVDIPREESAAVTDGFARMAAVEPEGRGAFAGERGPDAVMIRPERVRARRSAILVDRRESEIGWRWSRRRGTEALFLAGSEREKQDERNASTHWPPHRCDDARAGHHRPEVATLMQRRACLSCFPPGRREPSTDW